MYVMSAHDFLSVPEAAALLRVSPDTVRDWIREGRVRAWRIGPRGRYRISVASLNEYVALGNRR